MSLLWRSLSLALVAGWILVIAPGCKSGGGLWAPGWAKSGSSTSDLAVSRPPTKVPNPSSTATPSTASSLASSRSAQGAQEGPYSGGSTYRTKSNPSNSAYDNQAAAWQGEPHSSVAPAGGYQTGGPYSMAAAPAQPGVTPGAYAQPSGSAYPDNRTADQRNPQYPQTATAGAPYGADTYGAAGSATQPGSSAIGAAGGGAYEGAAASAYQEPSPGNAYAPDAGNAYGAPPPSTAPGAITEPAAATSDTSVYGDAANSLGGTGDATNPAAAEFDAGTSPPSAVAVPPARPSPTTSHPAPATSPTPTTSPSTSTAPFTPPTLPTSLSASAGGYRPGSTAAPGSRYGAANTIYEPPVTASGTGYSTVDGTKMR